MDGRVLVVGAGTMGSAIGCCAAMAGNDVSLYDADERQRDVAVERVRSLARDLVGYGLSDEDDALAALARTSVSSSLREASEDASLVVEAVDENLTVKQDLFAELDSLVPSSVPLLSNTSGLRITDIAAKTAHPERTLTAHFWLPAHLIPLVEIVVGERSSRQLAEQVRTELTTWGKSPVVVNRDLPGQLANRVLQAIIREAVNIVDIGLATAEDVDTAIKMGMALRLPVWGPLEHVDAVGLDVCRTVQDTVLPEISARTEAAPLFADLLRAGHAGYKTGQGLYDWTAKDMNALVKRRDDFIVFALKQIGAGRG